MAETMMSLGDFRFSVRTLEYQTLSTSMAWRWAKKDRYKHKPGKQFHGPDSSSKTLNITVHPENRADVVRLDRLRVMGDAGAPLRLVAGGTVIVEGEPKPSGADLGLWVIESLNIEDEYFLQDGTPLVRRGTLTISEYGEDEG
ncbi:TPA: phage tail protein [Pseudomonas aeruginosa]|uniref:phage tail protein n=1 Tax=Pseudomonas aeruginosa TaxID=287 RepID=UPI0006919141|nr:phage tail protein [Pseudomonas aeruginosa]EIU5460390.1 phage tail protein [Pseudomonas aeruginosa]EIU5543773.1 phage tail protein [Pseudomonas aeruginosa]EKW4494363.1 phage tail protein [Pseudomonas aeruginosa]EKY0078196.1 phage tail protein [Pseudomonas aeruginosa]EKY0500322.1 phage tail protein [Pseudomonas aeruginosa]